MAEAEEGPSHQWRDQRCMYFDPNCTISTRDPYSMRAKRRDANARSYGKQERRADPEVWRFAVLALGVVHFEVMGSDCRQHSAGQAIFVGRTEA